jgi:hypothetical protein
MPGLIRGVARTAVIAGTATSVSNRVSRRQAGRWAAKDQSAYDAEAAQQQEAPPPPPPAAYAPPPPPPAPDMNDKFAQLQQLGELHTQGILTDEEFAQQKTRILGS